MLNFIKNSTVQWGEITTKNATIFKKQHALATYS